MRVLLLNNQPSPYFLPVFRQVANWSGWDLLICFVARWRPESGWAEGSLEITLPARICYLENQSRLQSWSMLQLLWREHPDYIVCYGYTQAPQMTLLTWALLTGTPFALIGDANIHCDRAQGLRQRLKTIWLQLLTARAAAIVTIGTANRQFWLKYGAREKSLFSVPFVVDNHKFVESSITRREEAAVRRRELGLEGRIVFVSVGRLIKRKNVDLLIRAVRELDPTEPVALLIVGDGEERERLVAAAGPDQRIVFLGNIRPNDLPFTYSLADILVHCAQDEPWGLVTNEAMASGLAIIAHSKCGSTIDLVSDENGVVLQSFEVEEIVSAMRRLVSNPAQLERMKLRSQVKIADWSVEAAARGLIAAVEQSMNR